MSWCLLFSWHVFFRKVDYPQVGYIVGGFGEGFDELVYHVVVVGLYYYFVE